MRIISGKHKGRKFYPPDNLPTRPTTDFAKEALFNIIDNNFYYDEVKFLDLFMGTGSISYEFYSRGCEDITAVDKFPGCVKFAKSMIEKLGITGMKVYNDDALKFMSGLKDKYDIIFAGPPYAFEKIDELPDLILNQGILADEGWFILEHSPKHHFDNHPHLSQKRNYGTTIFSIFMNEIEKDGEK